MKTLKLTVLFLLLFACSFAQTKTTATITPAFTDSLKIRIARITPDSLNVKRLAYTSTISVEGKLTKPLITRQDGGGSEADSKFVVALKALIKAAPAWKPALDNSGKPVDSEVTFSIILNGAKSEIKQTHL